MKAGIVISIGKSGGFYVTRGYSTRICLGPVAITFIPEDGDKIIAMASMYGIHRQALMSAQKAMSDEMVYRKKDRRPPLKDSEYEYEETEKQLTKALCTVQRALRGEEEQNGQA